MRLLISLLLCLLSITTYAKPYLVTSETTLHNDNWYPLSKRDMKAAAVDTALSELTSNGLFEIAREDKDSRQHYDGKLLFDISLIGSAEVVKLTVTLHLEDNVTYVSSVSMDIHGMDYQGIYDAFEYVGTETAKRLNTKIGILQSEDNNISHEKAKGAAIKPNTDILSLYNQAQQLKREELFHEARVLFEAVIEDSSESERQWSKMAADELRYGLPIFEADNLMLDNSLQPPLLLQQKMETVAHLYRQILADNTDMPQRVIEVNRRLDNISISRKALANSIKASSLSRAFPLRMMLQEYYMSRGEWPDQPALKLELQRFEPEFGLVSYRVLNDQLELVVRDIKYGTETQIAGDMQNMTMQLK